MMWPKVTLWVGLLSSGWLWAAPPLSPVAAHTEQALITSDPTDPDAIIVAEDSGQTPVIAGTDNPSPQRFKRWGFFDILTPVGQNYLLPAHYTYETLKSQVGPPSDGVRHIEVKFQLNLQAALWSTIADTPVSWYMAYRQTSFWQAYVKSAFFRETNYEPSMYLGYRFASEPWNLQTIQWGGVHQSNGRGGDAERSWNRGFIEFNFSQSHRWFAHARLWMRIDGLLGSRDYNHDITHYLGHGKLRFGYRHHEQVFTLMLRNHMESGFKRGATEVTWSFPVYRRIRGYISGFAGYGQSLIDYNRRTHSLGMGISFSDYLDN